MKKLYLIRHGHTDNQGIFDSSSTIALNRQGIQAMTKLSHWLKKNHQIEALYTSPIARAQQSAQIVSTNLNIQTQKKDSLREIHFGDWEGKLYDEAYHSNPDYITEIIEQKDSFSFLNGEKMSDFNKRTWDVIETISQKPHKSAVLVTHKGVIESIICQILGISTIFPPLTIEPASCSIVLFDCDRWAIKLLNHTI